MGIGNGEDDITPGRRFELAYRRFGVKNSGSPSSTRALHPQTEGRYQLSAATRRVNKRHYQDQCADTPAQVRDNMNRPCPWLQLQPIVEQKTTLGRLGAARGGAAS